MAQLRAFNIRLIPAWENGPFIATSPFDTLHKEDIEASSVSELVTKAAAIATTLGKPCQAYVSIRDGGRKPRGFDEATARLYYNLEVKPEEGRDKPQTPLSQYAASL